jgi:hypothetical protein
MDQTAHVTARGKGVQRQLGEAGTGRFRRPSTGKDQDMARFSLGIWPSATGDLRRILNAVPPYLRPFIGAATRRLLAEVRIDPHLKGSPAPMVGRPHLRQFDMAGVRIYFQVRQPPLQDLYVEVVGFSLVP